MTKRILLLLCIVLCVKLSYTQVDYDTEIQPLFNNSCMPCHSGASPSAGLALDNGIESVLSTVVPGDYENSLLYQRITSSTNPMPPTWSSNEALTAEEVNLIVTWINELGGDENPWGDIVSTGCNMTVLFPEDMSIIVSGQPISEAW